MSKRQAATDAARLRLIEVSWVLDTLLARKPHPTEREDLANIVRAARLALLGVLAVLDEGGDQ